MTHRILAALAAILCLVALPSLGTSTAWAYDPLFSGPLDFGVGAGAASVASADLDGDGDFDLATVNPGNTASLLFNAVAACPITMTGDVQGDHNITSADIVFLVNFVLKAGPAPTPCAAVDDVNCTGTVGTADIIYLVNRVFKAGPDPCNVCSLVPGTWTCP
jgi:hypothetical protein